MLKARNRVRCRQTGHVSPDIATFSFTAPIFLIH